MNLDTAEHSKLMFYLHPTTHQRLIIDFWAPITQHRQDAFFISSLTWRLYRAQTVFSYIVGLLLFGTRSSCQIQIFVRSYVHDVDLLFWQPIFEFPIQGISLSKSVFDFLTVRDLHSPSASCSFMGAASRFEFKYSWGSAREFSKAADRLRIHFENSTSLRAVAHLPSSYSMEIRTAHTTAKYSCSVSLYERSAQQCERDLCPVCFVHFTAAPAN